MIEMIIIISMFCLGLHYAAKEGNILSFVPLWVPDWICKMIFDCAPCMSTIYGTIIMFFFSDVFTLPVIILSIGASSGLSYIGITMCNSIYFIAKSIEQEIEQEDNGDI